MNFMPVMVQQAHDVETTSYLCQFDVICLLVVILKLGNLDCLLHIVCNIFFFVAIYLKSHGLCKRLYDAVCREWISGLSKCKLHWVERNL